MERIAQERAQDAPTPRRIGYIKKRGEDTSLVRIFNGRDAQGKRRYINKTIKGKKKCADTYLSKTVSSIRSGTFIEPLRMTLGEYLDKWLQTAARPRLRLRTYEYYVEMLKRYVRPVLGKKKAVRLAHARHSSPIYSHGSA